MALKSHSSIRGIKASKYPLHKGQTVDIGEGTKSTPSIPPLHVPRRPLLPNPHQRKIRPQIHKQRFNAQRNRRQKQKGAATDNTQSDGRPKGFSPTIWYNGYYTMTKSKEIKSDSFFSFFSFFFDGNRGHKMVNLKIIGRQSRPRAPWPHRGGGGGDDDMMRFHFISFHFKQTLSHKIHGTK